MVLASVLGIWFGPAAPYSQHFPRHILYVGIVVFFFFFNTCICIYMVEVRSAAFVGVRDTFFDEPTDWDIICRYQNKIEFVCFVLLISFK
jgi:hypothetical protein